MDQELKLSLEVGRISADSNGATVDLVIKVANVGDFVMTIAVPRADSFSDARRQALHQMAHISKELNRQCGNMLIPEE